MNGRLRNMTAIYLCKGDRLLLLFRQGSRVADRMWTGSAGGHFEAFELNDARACVLRELKEELGLELDDLEQLALRYVTLRDTNGEIRQNYYFFARLKDEVPEDLSSNEGMCRWFRRDEISALPMPFTAKHVTAHYLRIGQFTDALYVGVTTTEGVTFLELPQT